jgi:hypothetical protein
MPESTAKKILHKRLVIVPDGVEPKKNKSKMHKKVVIISKDDNEDNKIKEMYDEINKKKKELDKLTLRFNKTKAIVVNNKNKKFNKRVQKLPDEIISIIFRYAITPHASKKEIVDVYNEREKLRIQWERWEKLPHPRQPHFETFEVDQEYMNINPGINLYEILDEVSNKNDPCSMTYMPSECMYNGNILMGRVKISLGFCTDTRVEDVNTLRWDSLNACAIRGCHKIDLKRYFSKTTWRGNNETGNYKNQKKKSSNFWVYGWGPIRIDNIKTMNDGNISMSFINDLWYPSRRNLFNELNYIYSYDIEFQKIKNMLEINGVDVSRCETRRDCYRKFIRS